MKSFLRCDSSDITAWLPLIRLLPYLEGSQGYRGLPQPSPYLASPVPDRLLRISPRPQDLEVCVSAEATGDRRGVSMLQTVKDNRTIGALGWPTGHRIGVRGYPHRRTSSDTAISVETFASHRPYRGGASTETKISMAGR